MPVFKGRNVLSGMKVKEAMRREVIRMPGSGSMKTCVRNLIKLKRNAVLVEGLDGKPEGVVSKTDIMGAYYADLPAGTNISDVMTTPPQVCHPDDLVEDALDAMQVQRLHRIYVQRADGHDILGTLAFSDIIGLMYRYCRTCTKSGRKPEALGDKQLPRLLVEDVMTTRTSACREKDSIATIIEVLSTRNVGAVLVMDDNEQPTGIISKTDLNIAYIHGIALTDPVRGIMNAPVICCNPTALLSSAIQQMLVYDVQRLFVREAETSRVRGVLALSDATRFRSGTCKACGYSRQLETRF